MSVFQLFGTTFLDTLILLWGNMTFHEVIVQIRSIAAVFVAKSAHIHIFHLGMRVFIPDVTS